MRFEPLVPPNVEARLRAMDPSKIKKHPKDLDVSIKAVDLLAIRRQAGLKKTIQFNVTLSKKPVCRICCDELTQDNAAPSILIRGRGSCRVCSALAHKAYRIRNPKSAILCRLRNNARVRGIDFRLNVADIPDTPEFCPVFPWIKLDYQVGDGRSDGSPSVDRINNNIGYVPGNIRIVSDRANYVKGDATDEELIALGKDALSRKAQ